MLPSLSRLSLACPSCKTPKVGTSLFELLSSGTSNEPATCGICLDPLTADSTNYPWTGLPGRSGPWMRTVCDNDHVFHTGCAVNIVLTNPDRPEKHVCPDCRSPLKPIILQLAADVAVSTQPQPAQPAQPAQLAAPQQQDTEYMETDADGHEYYWSGRWGRLMRVVAPPHPLVGGDTLVIYYEGPRGEEHIDRIESSNGRVEHYVGPNRQERKVSEEYPDGDVWRYEGEKGEEHLVLIDHINGNVTYYEGPRGEERKVRTEFPNGKIWYFEGEKDEEHLVRKELPNGQIRYFEGEQGQERVVRIESPDGQIWYFEGAKGQERVVRSKFPEGHIVYFEGAQGEERKVRTEFPNGRIHYYEGLRGQERFVRRRTQRDREEENEEGSDARRQRISSVAPDAGRPHPLCL